MESLVIKNVPFYSREDIESKAIELISIIDAACLDAPIATPIGLIVETLLKDHNINFIFHEELGFLNSRNKILGKCNLQTKTIYIDPSIKDHEGRLRFTIAHEIGHLILHKQVNFTAIVPVFEDDIEQLYRIINQPLSDIEWLEWHANKFASSLLMPRNTFNRFVSSILDRKAFHLNPGKIFLDDQQCNKDSFNEILHEIRSVFLTSKQAAEIRLRELKYVIDHRQKSSTMSDLLTWITK